MLKRLICWFTGHSASPPVKVAERVYKQTCRKCEMQRFEMWSSGSMGEIEYTEWTK